MAGRKREVPEAPGKVRLEIRIDADLAERVQKLADDAGMSVNQLMQGITRAVAERGHVGVVDVDEKGELSEGKKTPGCVWFGEVTDVYDGPDGKPYLGGFYWFGLDYSDRRAILERKPVGQLKEIGKGSKHE